MVFPVINILLYITKLQMDLEIPNICNGKTLLYNQKLKVTTFTVYNNLTM